MKSYRYKRQINLKDVGIEGQEKIGSASVLVIGAGGLGCPALAYLASMGVGHITICDFDTIEESNLHRQPLFTPADIGKSKAEIASLRIKEINPELNITILNKRLDYECGQDEVSKHDVVLDCTDNFKTKFLVHDLCYQHGVDLVQASIHQYDGTLNVFSFSEGGRSPCMRCLWPEQPADGCVGTCAEAGVLGAVPGVLGTLQAVEAMKLILDFEVLNNGVTLMVDLLSMQMDRLAFKESSNCPICSSDKSDELFFGLSKDKLESYELSLSDVESFKEFTWFDIRGNDEVEKCNHKLRKKLHDCNSLSILNHDYDYSGKERYIFFCQKGIRSKRYVAELRKQGVNAYSLHGGLSGCP